MLRLDGDGKGDAFAGEFTIDNLAYLHAVKNERLTSINTVTFRRGQGQRQNIRFMQQCFFAWHNTFVIFISRILAQLAAGFMGGNRDEGEESNGNPLIYFAVATVLELVFGILASIITMWFSRHREFHADAGSAKLVGREKMIAALQRLKTSYEPQEATSMMAFCINGVRVNT